HEGRGGQEVRGRPPGPEDRLRPGSTLESRRLKDFRHHITHYIPDGGYSQPDHKHIDPAADHPPARENTTRASHREVRQHGDRERDPGRRRSAEHHERRHRDKRLHHGGRAGHPPLLEGGGVRFADLQLFAHLLSQGALWVAHHLDRHLACDPGLDPLRLVDQRELVLLHVGHETDLFLLHRDLVGVHLLLALGGEVPGGAHRERVCDHPRDPRDQDDVRRGGGAQHTRHETKIRGQAVV